MMKLAVFSDIHGNGLALEAALADLATVGDVDHLWVLGDLAAFGSRPAECLRRLRDLCAQFAPGKCRIIGGNTDRYLVTGERFRLPPAEDEGTFNTLVGSRSAVDAVLNWNLSRLGWEDYQFLAEILGRETAVYAEDYGYVIGYHAVPGDDEGWLRPNTPDEEAVDYLLDREGRLAIGGHIHLQMDRSLGDWRVINVGSVGMSWETPGQAQWGLFTFNNGQVTVDLRAVPYDIHSVIADFTVVGYPLAEWGLQRLRFNPGIGHEEDNDHAQNAANAGRN